MPVLSGGPFFAVDDDKNEQSMIFFASTRRNNPQERGEIILRNLCLRGRLDV